MEGTSSTSFCRQFTSPWRNLAWSFRKSRDTWKKKYQDLKVEHKRLENQVRDVRKSRAQWRNRAEQTQQQNQTLRQQLARGQAELTMAKAADEKKG
jgi:predicted  nucleic acid-binding Zn-ribbon protein